MMVFTNNLPKKLRNDYAAGMTSDEANNWLNEHIQLSPTYILESGILRDWKGNQGITNAFRPGTIESPLEPALGLLTERKLKLDSIVETHRTSFLPRSVPASFLPHPSVNKAGTKPQPIDGQGWIAQPPVLITKQGIPLRTKSKMPERKIAGRRQGRRRQGRWNKESKEKGRTATPLIYRNLTANLPPNRDGGEEGRAGLVLGYKGRGGRHRGRRSRGGWSRANQSWNAK